MSLKIIIKIFSVSVLLLLISGCATTSDSELVGEWRGMDSTGEVGSIILKSNKQAQYIKGPLILDGTWSANNEQEIVELDLTVRRVDEIFTLPMIVRFLTRDKIQLRVSEDPNVRPSGFSPVEINLQIILERQ